MVIGEKLMQEDKIPKIFISYSWTSTEMVLELAKRLVIHGIDTVLDKWDLKEGQDKYEFMEQCVNDDSIDKVLIVCDKTYMEKANSRTGGVGDETVIISSEVYGNTKQEKFIPIIAEKDDEGNAYVPTYIKSRIYIDLSDEEKYEEEYEKLIRNIYNKPLYSKPKLGKRPEWLDEDKTNLFPLTDLIRQIKGATTSKKERSCIDRFVSEYIETLKTYKIENLTNAKQVFDRFVEMKSVRDVFLDFLPVLHEADVSFADTITGCLEKMYNTLTCIKGFDDTLNHCKTGDFEIYKIHTWELFICITAFLRYKQDYKSINGILTNTYFLNTSSLEVSTQPTNYCEFRYRSSSIEDEYKPTTNESNKYTLTGNEVCTKRTKLPIYTREALAEADLFLYQVRNAMDIVTDDRYYFGEYWFPNLYVYVENTALEWQKMKSRKYCKKMFDLFGVENIDDLKNAISKCVYNDRIRYNSSFNTAPAILNYIKIEEIGSIN